MPPPARPQRQSLPVQAIPPVGQNYVAPPLGDGFEPETIRMREGTIDDIEQLEELNREDFGNALKDFKTDRAGEEPTDEELAADVRRFMEAIRA